MFRKLGLVTTIGASGLFLTGCTVSPPDNAFFDALRMGWPKGVTPEAQEMGNFWVWVWVAAWIIGIIMWTLMFYAIFAFSAKKAEKDGKGEFPRQTGYNVPLELVLTTVPVIIIMTLFFFNVQVQDKATALDKNPQVTVDVTAFQWNWKFGYNKVSGELLGTGQDYVGTDAEAQKRAEESRTDDNHYAHGVKIEGGPIHGRAKDDYSYLRFNQIETTGATDEIPVLVLPTNTPIEFDLASADVAHSFWVPEFLFKRDAFPHPLENQAERRFQIQEIQRTGAYVGRCTEMCGTYHAMMNFEIRAVTPEQFRQYIEFRKNNPDAENSKALSEIGEQPYATSTKPFVSGREATRSVEPDTNIRERNA